MTYSINVGDNLPNFSCKDQNGHTVTDDDLIGGPVVIYFYPKDETPGCTKEACSFRDKMQELLDMEVLVIGVSPDSVESHKQFEKNHSLNFPLLSDENLELCRKFDALKKVDGKPTTDVERSTFVIDPDAIIRWIERPASVDGHVDRVIAAVKRYSA